MHKISYACEAVEKSVPEKVNALQNMIFREITKCAFNTASDKKIVTRFKLDWSFHKNNNTHLKDYITFMVELSDLNSAIQQWKWFSDSVRGG